MAYTELKIDLADPNAVRANLPRIKGLLAEQLKEAERMRLDLVALTDQISLLETLVQTYEGAPADTGAEQQRAPLRRPRKSAPAQERIVAAMEQAKREYGPAGSQLGPSSLFEFMEQEGLAGETNANAVGANLWAAWKSGRVMKAPNGVYTLLDGSGRTEHDHPLTDYWHARRMGMPTP